MEFERAIFRVYERCLEGLRDDENDSVNSKTCRAFELLSLGGAVFFLLTLIFLHLSFVGRPGCLPGLLQERLVQMNITSGRYKCKHLRANEHDFIHCLFTELHIGLTSDLRIHFVGRIELLKIWHASRNSPYYSIYFMAANTLQLLFVTLFLNFLSCYLCILFFTFSTVWGRIIYCK